ncbi:hypothetical protein ACFL6N_08120 [Thermodesulfobacteriota bacterium]
MIETILTWLIVALAAFFSVRALYKTLTGKNTGCSCNQSCQTTTPSQGPPQCSPGDPSTNCDSQQEKADG